VWEYVRTELKGNEFKAAQRRLVEMFRKAPRAFTHPVGKYMKREIPHHIKCAYDDDWAVGPQAANWLEDTLHGIVDVISVTTASLLPARQLAEEAEAASNWWGAALRYNAAAHAISSTSGSFSGGIVLQRKAFDMVEKASSNDARVLAAVFVFDQPF
jgi:hypothetical protein